MSPAWPLLFPPLQPHDGGWLEVGDGHALRYEVAGHPGAPAALALHGGPGAGCTPDDRRWFDPGLWRIVTMDQRGSGRSRARRLLHANTTAHLVADIERLRHHLGIERWLLFGGSWGSTLALAWAQAHPQRCSGLVLRGVFTATSAESDWLYGGRGAARLQPAAWQALCKAAGARAPAADLLARLHARLAADDDASAAAAALAWWNWEQDLMDKEAIGLLSDHGDPRQRKPPPTEALLAQARIGVHYARAGWFLAEGQLLAQADRLRGIPGVIVQGALDLVTPPTAARALHAAWPDSRLHELATAGHAAGQPAIARQLLAGVQSLASTRLECPLF